ncbi:MAG: tripartite tricarboxylate transporter substrate binding protein [Deltaproteobacteria bacterium]|nr:tripartite tricarboxylate transporter substrate binding protein [Deltaproteobacteria bacterium]
MLKRFGTALCVAVIIVALTGGGALAGTFPDKNLKIIVPFAPGGGVDVTCRMIAEVAPKHLNGKKIVVENMPGGGAVIGQTYVAKAKPDGYTILAYTSSVVSNPMTKKTSFTHTSYQPIAMYCFDPEILIVPAKSPYDSLKAFIEAAQKKEVSVATPGYSTSHHIASLILEDRLGVKFGYIHNQSAAMQVQQLLGGHVEAGMMAMGETTQYVKDGSLKALGLMIDVRNPDFSAIPTFKEEGIDLVWGAFRGLAVPKDTPADTVKALDEAFKNIVADPDFNDRMQKAGFPVVYRNASDFTAYVGVVAEKLGKILPTLKKQ